MTAPTEPTSQDSLAPLYSAFEVHPEDLPTGEDYTFTSNHSFQLPSPAQVRARAVEQGIDITRSFRPDPVRYPELGLIVKWGEDVTIAEGQCIWYMSHHRTGSVPVPRIFGWKRDGQQTFLYLELVSGDTLASRWSDMTAAEKTAISEQLGGIVRSWRRLTRPAGVEISLSNISSEALRDIMFSDAGAYPAGPFADVTAFHDHLATLVSSRR
jgi:hypothetical protein